MAKEFEEERLTAERLWNAFRKDWLSLQEVAKYDGCDPRTAKRRYGITAKGISISSLAHMKCLISRK